MLNPAEWKLETLPDPVDRCFVRLRTTSWSDRRGLHIRKSLTYLKRMSNGFNILEHDLSESSIAEDTLHRIININECEDGIYEVIECNVLRDRETGYVDDYNLRLVK